MEAVRRDGGGIHEPAYPGGRGRAESVEGTVNVDLAGDPVGGHPRDHEGQMDHHINALERCFEARPVADVAAPVRHLGPTVLRGLERPARNPDHPGHPRIGLQERNQAEPERAGRSGHRDGQAGLSRCHPAFVPAAHPDVPPDRRYCGAGPGRAMAADVGRCGEDAMSTREPVPGGAGTGVPAAGDRLPGETVLRDGTPAFIWPLLPSDAEGLRDGFRHLSPDSRRHRFLTSLPELDDAMIRLLVGGVDGVHHIALVLVVVPPDGVDRPVGVGRLVQDADDPAAADIAVTVTDDWQGRGVGTALAEALIEARPAAVTRLSTVVEAENTASRALLARLGAVSSRPAGYGLLDVTVDLGVGSGGTAGSVRLTMA